MKKLECIVIALLLGAMSLSGQTPIRPNVGDSCKTAGCAKDSFRVLKQTGKDSAMIVPRQIKTNCFGGHKLCDSIRTDTFTLKPMQKTTTGKK